MSNYVLQPIVLPDGKVRFPIDTGKSHIDILISQEDLEFVSRLNLKVALVRGKPKISAWADRKSIALSRLIKEGFDPPTTQKSLVVRHRNSDYSDFTRENLVWSTTRNGPLVVNEESNPDKYTGRTITWKGEMMIFNTQEEAADAKRKLQSGYPECMIHETGRKRSRGISKWIKDSSKKWSSWLSWRKYETAEIVEWISGARSARPYETAGLRLMFLEGWQRMESDSCLMLAVATAEWMTRKVQDEPNLEGRSKTLDRNLSVMLWEMVMRDPFDELDDPFLHGCDDLAYASKPEPKGGTFILMPNLEEKAPFPE